MLKPIDDAGHIGGTVSIAIVAVAAHEVHHDAESAELVRLRHTSLVTEKKNSRHSSTLSLFSTRPQPLSKKNSLHQRLIFPRRSRTPQRSMIAWATCSCAVMGGESVGAEMFRSRPVREAL